ncbi:hypothetical protein [Novosphingobium sp.]|uniref:hypothetical protein n=1 Tax=Novosphingobium sp. TaxID=1874826 RepID=UPI001E111B5C|nr:hypothetical protein [Novosphingobium sp.]MBX9664602.1 hypothetical protein [Novosphingobium sp.]
MNRNIAASCALLLAVAASAPQRYDWSGEKLEETFGSETASDAASTQNACRARLIIEPPASDWPSAREREELKGCDSEALYYGIGRTADPVAARKCALIEREREVGPSAPDFAGLGYSYFSGTGILAMIYANGTGTARNLDVAIHMACGVEDAPAASMSRIAELLERQTGKGRGGKFEICNDATSGISEGYCADHANRLAEQIREQRTAALGARWTEPQHRLFAQVFASFSKYAEIAHDMDCFGGTAHVACTIVAASADQDDFLHRIEALAAGRRPAPRTLHDGGSPSPAIAPLDLAGVPKEQRWSYRNNYQAAVASRAIFERDLVAFMRAAFPEWSAHDVRVMFRDL